MIAASQTIGRFTRGSLAALVAIMLLATPMAEAVPTVCGNDAEETEHADTLQDLGGPVDDDDDHQKNCCVGVCSWCSVAIPAPNLVVLRWDSSRHGCVGAPQSLIGLISSPDIGPPRSTI